MQESKDLVSKDHIYFMTYPRTTLVDDLWYLHLNPLLISLLPGLCPLCTIKEKYDGGQLRAWYAGPSSSANLQR